MGRGCKDDRHAGDGTLAHKLLGFCGDGDGQSGLGAYVRQKPRIIGRSTVMHHRPRSSLLLSTCIVRGNGHFD